MKHRKIAFLALAGMVSAAPALADFGKGQLAAAEGDGDAAEGEDGEGEGGSRYSKVHDCAGLNVCKGLGGCAVTEEKLAKLAEKRGIPVEEAGEPHGCAGQNACKGLGGCHVTEEKFAKLKARQEEAEGEESEETEEAESN